MGRGELTAILLRYRDLPLQAGGWGGRWQGMCVGVQEGSSLPDEG